MRKDEMMRKAALLTLLVVLLAVYVPSVGAQSVTVNGFTVTFNGRTYVNGANQTTFTYTVTGNNQPPALSHFDLEIPNCTEPLDVIAYSPSSAVEFGTDPTTGVSGIKWDLPLQVNASRVYSVTFAGSVGQGDVAVAVKGGPGFELGTIPGPSCTEALISVKKFVSVDNGMTWDDAELTTGPIVSVGQPVSFLIEVTNTGDFPLNDIVLTDSVFSTASCTIPAVLELDAAFECLLGPFEAVEGQHSNTASVTASYEDITVTDSDRAHYFAGSLPRISVEKYVSFGGTWFAADTAPGVEIPADRQVSFRIVVSNDGTETMNNISLTDSLYDVSGCAIPASMTPGESAECVIGPFSLTVGNSGTASFVNVATVTATYAGETFTDSDAAHYFVAEQDDDAIIIIIEGPIEVIINNRIIIYGREIILDPNDPLLLVIRVGDKVRIEGELVESGTTVIVVAIIIIIIDVDIYINDGGGAVWRNECANPPPPWAPAHGWRRKCEGASSKAAKPGRGRGRGN
jgi:hypothetical protein